MQPDCKCCAAAGRIADMDAPAVGGYDFLCDTEAEAEMFFSRAGGVNAVKAVENMFFLAVRDTGPVVGNLKVIDTVLEAERKFHITARQAIADCI